MTEVLLSTAAAAARRGVERRSIYRWVAQGLLALAARTEDGRLLFRAADVDAVVPPRRGRRAGRGRAWLGEAGKEVDHGTR